MTACKCHCEQGYDASYFPRHGEEHEQRSHPEMRLILNSSGSPSPFGTHDDKRRKKPHNAEERASPRDD